MQKREQVFLNGEWRDANDGATFEISNPSTGNIIGTAPMCGRAETIDAINAASTAFPGWRDAGAEARSAIIYRLYEALMDNKQALAEILTEEMGKPIREAVGEIIFGANFFKWFAEEARRVYGDVIPSPWPNKRMIVTKEPVGVVGAITPWNFPSSMIARKLSAAMAAGCTMVVKPAPQTPYSAFAFGDLATEAGVPKGVVNIITGDAPAIGAELCEHPAVRKITFTGSTPIGKMLAAQAGAHMKRVSMELGGNAPFLVFGDADIDAAVKGAMAAKFRNAGQTCICANRILVHSSIYDPFAEKLEKAVNQLTIGDGMEEDVTHGPLIDSAAVAKVEDHIADAVGAGAKILAGGTKHAKGGNFFQPTLLSDVTQPMKIFNNETFGPVAPLIRFETEEEAIAMANDTEYGLACYAYTKDLGRAWRLSEKLEYGMVAINEGFISSEVAPFGGVKESGIGKEGSKYGLDDYLNVKYSLFGGLD